ncbi:arsenite/tail-anchored protein-transporting ATPase, partial [Phenoliferia sp. Uapishka_3]
STDPAHNLSDAFSQKFGRDATPVNGFTNLSAMEIDPNSSMQEMMEGQDADSGMGGMMQDLAFAIPGIDEAMGFAEVMKHVKSMQFSVIGPSSQPSVDTFAAPLQQLISPPPHLTVFDTAPTGHTLRFLSFPSVLEKALSKLSTLSGRFGPMLNQMSSMMGAGVNTSEMFEKLESMRTVVTEVNTQFKNPDLTTFIPVMSMSSVTTELRILLELIVPLPHQSPNSSPSTKPSV